MTSSLLTLIAKAALLRSRGLPPTTIAQELLSPHSLRSLYEVAHALHHRDGGAFSAEEVARVFAHADGMRLPNGAIAWLLYSQNGLALNATQAATVLHAPNGLDLSLEEVARALYAEGNLDLRTFEVRVHLAGEGPVGLAPRELIPAMASVAPDDPSLIRAVFPLTQAHLRASQDKMALLDGLVAHLQTDHPFPLLAKVLLTDGSFQAPHQLARFLAAAKGFDLPPQTIVYAFTHSSGPRLPLEVVADILTNPQALALPGPLAIKALEFGAGVSADKAWEAIDPIDRYVPFPGLAKAQLKPTASLATSRRQCSR